MKIKEIFDEIANEPGSNAKMEILAKYKDNELLKKVLYQANSKRIKFYIKQIPNYSRKSVVFEGALVNPPTITLEEAVSYLSILSNRTKTGNTAIDFLSQILYSLEPEDAYIIERIIDKDCKIGMGTSNINKVFPKLIEDTPYMGAKSFDVNLVNKLFENGGTALSQIKMDGRYCNAIVRNGDVELESRQGEPTLLEGADFLKELRLFPGDFEFVLNGELTIDSVEKTITIKKDETIEIDGVKYTTSEVIDKFC